MNKYLWTFIGLALLTLVIMTTSGCATYRNIDGDHSTASASTYKQEIFGGNGNDRQSEKSSKKGHHGHKY